MLKSKTLQIDFQNINTYYDFHNHLQVIFGFPDFYGKNIHALIDCLSDLRIPGADDTVMVTTRLAIDEIIVLELKNCSQTDEGTIKQLLIAIEDVNDRSIKIFGIPSIAFVLV